MKVMVDIPYEAIIQAAEEIAKKKGVCRVLPCARFEILDDGKWKYFTLVCDERMEGKRTGAVAEYCENCISGGNKNDN